MTNSFNKSTIDSVLLAQANMALSFFDSKEKFTETHRKNLEISLRVKNPKRMSTIKGRARVIEVAMENKGWTV